jgi:hypothetical protein
MTVPEGCCTATIRAEHCNATFCLQQLYAAAVLKDQSFEDMPPITIADLNLEGQAEDHIAKEDHTTLDLPGGYWDKEHNVLATLLCLY